MVWNKKKQVCYLLSIIITACVLIFPGLTGATTGPEEIQESEEIKETEEIKKESTFHIQNMDIQTLLNKMLNDDSSPI